MASHLIVKEERISPDKLNVRSNSFVPSKVVFAYFLTTCPEILTSDGKCTLK